MAINKISILLPVYNTPKEWLTDSVQSILNQTHKDFELLILDDGSSNPGTQQSLTDLEKIDSRISVKKNKSNLGLAKNLNQGLLLAKHQWVARMDSDDIAHPDRLKQQIHFLNKNNEVSILGTNIQCFDGSTRIIRHPTTHREISTSMLWGCQVAHPTVIYNKNTILSVGGYPEDKQNAEDYALWTKSLLAAPTQNSITYRRHFWTTECKEIEKNTTAFRKSTATLYAKTFGKIAISTPTSVTYFNAR